MAVTETEYQFTGFDLGMIRILQTVNIDSRLGNIQLRPIVEMDEHFWDRLCNRLIRISDEPWEFVLAYDRDRDRLVIGDPAKSRIKLISVVIDRYDSVIDRYDSFQQQVLFRCPKLQQVNFRRVIYNKQNYAKYIFSDLEWAITRAVKEYEASGRSLWTK